MKHFIDVISFFGTTLFAGLAIWNVWQVAKPSKRTNLLLALAIFLSLSTLTGCNRATLAPGGVYSAQANGTNIYQADLAIVTSYDELDAFVTWEKANHAWLASNYPPVVASANNIRVNAPHWRDTAVKLRNAYAAISTAANSNAMATAIAVMEAGANQVTNYLTLTH